AGRGHHLHEGHRRRVVRHDAEPQQPRPREDQGVGLAVLELAEPRVDVAAQVLDEHVGPPPENLRLTADARGPDPRPRREVAVAGHEDVEGGGRGVRRRSSAEARWGTAAITRPSVSPAGRSFAEWTARSTSPSRSARTISGTNTPLRPSVQLRAAPPRREARPAEPGPEQPLPPGPVSRRVAPPVARGRDGDELGLDARRGER